MSSSLAAAALAGRALGRSTSSAASDLQADTTALLCTTMTAAFVVVLGCVLALRSRTEPPTEDMDEVQRALAERRPAAGIGGLLSLASTIALVIVAWRSGLTDQLDTVENHAFPNPRVYGADGAWLLALLAAVAATAALLRRAAQRGRVRLHYLGAVIAAVLAVCVAVTVVARSNDSRNVESTTASAVPVPALPAKVGEHRFSLSVDDLGSASVTVSQVAAAGAGFVVLESRGLRAYDAAGRSRWTYLRRDRRNIRAAEMRVYDEGHTVVVRFRDTDHPPGFYADKVLAFDTMTGERLWESADFDGAFLLSGDVRNPIDGDFMMRMGGDGRVTRIDTRTGRPAWTVSLPGGQSCSGAGTKVADAIVYATECRTGREVTLRVASIDPGTGRTTVDTEVERFTTTWAGTLPLKVLAADAKDVGLQDVRLESERNGLWRIVRRPSGPSLWSGRPARFVGEPGTRLLTRERELAYALRTEPDLDERCRIPASGALEDTVSWLPSEVIVPRDGSTLSLFDPNNCALRRTLEAGGDRYAQVVPAPGVLLTVKRHGSNLIVDGYAGPTT